MKLLIIPQGKKFFKLGSDLLKLCKAGPFRYSFEYFSEQFSFEINPKYKIHPCTIIKT